MTRTRWIIFAVLCLGILGLILVTNKKDSGSNWSGDATKIISAGPIADHVFGSAAQKVTLIEYGDYQCPGCESVYPTLKSVTDKYKDNLTFIFRNMPLTNLHPNALAAATAAEAAGLQGKYYEYHDALYDNQSAWKDASANDRTSTFETYAKQLGLDVNRFKSDLSNSQVTDKINRDRATAKTFDVTSTPTVILNGQKVPQDTVFDKAKLTQLINDEYQKAGLKPPAAD
jgi:protein-disulfide isomerase